MTGGAFKIQCLLSRRREIEEFEKTVKQLKSEMDSWKNIVTDFERKEPVTMKRLNHKGKTSEGLCHQNTAKMNVDQAEGRIRSIFQYVWRI